MLIFPLRLPQFGEYSKTRTCRAAHHMGSVNKATETLVYCHSLQVRFANLPFRFFERQRAALATDRSLKLPEPPAGEKFALHR